MTRHYLSAEWRSIGGAYYSLGHPALQRDQRGYRVHDSFTLLDRSLALSLGFEQDEDNLADVKAATTTSSGVFADLNWQAAPDRPGVNASIRVGSRTNDLPEGEDGALDESSRTFGLGILYPVTLVEGLRTRINVNWSLITRDDPKNEFVGSSNHYYLAGVSGETLDRGTEFSLMYGLNRSVLTEFDNVHTDFRRVQATGRRQITERWTALGDGTLTLARTPEEALEFGLIYNRNELMLGGEFEWTSSSFVTFQAGVVSYADDRFPERDTTEILTRLRVNRPF